MTPQEIFDFVIPKLRTQGERSMDDDGTESCLYRGDNDHRCAVGWLIPDEAYDPSIEGFSCDWIAVWDRLPFEVDDETISFLVALQTFHDSALNWDSDGLKEECVQAFAEWFGLEVPE